jgi:hypothetical protein
MLKQATPVRKPGRRSAQAMRQPHLAGRELGYLHRVPRDLSVGSAGSQGLKKARHVGTSAFRGRRGRLGRVWLKVT